MPPDDETRRTTDSTTTTGQTTVTNLFDNFRYIPSSSRSDTRSASSSSSSYPRQSPVIHSNYPKVFYSTIFKNSSTVSSVHQLLYQRRCWLAVRELPSFNNNYNIILYYLHTVLSSDPSVVNCAARITLITDCFTYTITVYCTLIWLQRRPW